MNRWHRVALCAASALVFAGSAHAVDRVATVTLGRDPEPPFCILNPGGTVDIFWDIEHQTTPNYVLYKLEDPTRTITLEEETYPGGTGIHVARQWIAPNGLPDGKYWVRVEYWSYQAGNEANAEVTFYICQEMGNLCVHKYKDANCNETFDPDDPPIADWWLCFETPQRDVICELTDAEGKVCWFGIPLGLYRVFEMPMDGWQPVGPNEVQVDLIDGQVVNENFLNTRYDECYGACCFDDGSCAQITEAACASQSGTFHGLGSFCAEVTCPLPEACCFPDGSCIVLLPEDCSAQGGEPQGKGTTCEPNTCPHPVPGACCFADGSCQVLTEEQCQEAGGTQWIEGDDCEEPTSCPPVATESTTWGRIKATYR